MSSARANSFCATGISPYDGIATFLNAMASVDTLRRKSAKRCMNALPHVDSFDSDAANDRATDVYSDTLN